MKVCRYCSTMSSFIFVKKKFVLRAKKLTLSRQFWLECGRLFGAYIYKFANFARLYFPYFTTFPCNFTNLKMLLLTVPINFVPFA